MGYLRKPTLLNHRDPWTADLTFTTQAILPIEETAQINGEALAWRDAN